MNIPRGYKDAPGSWWLAPGDTTRVVVACPECGQPVSLPVVRVQPDGLVTHGFSCGWPKCGFTRVQVILDDWHLATPPSRPGVTY